MSGVHNSQIANLASCLRSGATSGNSWWKHFRMSDLLKVYASIRRLEEEMLRGGRVAEEGAELGLSEICTCFKLDFRRGDTGSDTSVVPVLSVSRGSKGS